MFLIIYECSALMARSAAVQSSNLAASGCTAPAGIPPEGDTLKEKPTPDLHTRTRFILQAMRSTQREAAHHGVATLVLVA